MKEFFLYGVLITIPVAIALYFLFALGKSLVGMASDWQLGRELDELEKHGEQRRQSRDEANRQRLDNGCQHVFDSPTSGFPPGACAKCGLEREKPVGPCDHQWQAADGPVPSAVCAKCGRSYKPTAG